MERAQKSQVISEEASPWQNANAIVEAQRLPELEEQYRETCAKYERLLRELGHCLLAPAYRATILSEELYELEISMVEEWARMRFAYSCARYVKNTLGVDLSWEIPD